MKKYLPLFLLFFVVSASLFMVAESGEYYSTFYKEKYKGYWAAFLVEGFLAIAAMFYVSDNKVLNVCIKLVMIPLFLVVVGGASLNVASPMMATLAKVESKKQLVEHLDEQNQQIKTHLALLDGQRMNTALAIKHQRQISNQIASELKNQSSSPWMIWVVMGFSTFLRFSVQLANLVFAHCLGQIWRNKNSSVNTSAKTGACQTAKSSLQFKYQRIFQYLKRNNGKVTRGQIVASKVLKGGVKEYDRILGGLEKTGKINVDKKKDSKADWVYLIV